MAKKTSLEKALFDALTITRDLKNCDGFVDCYDLLHGYEAAAYFTRAAMNAFAKRHLDNMSNASVVVPGDAPVDALLDALVEELVNEPVGAPVLEVALEVALKLTCILMKSSYSEIFNYYAIVKVYGNAANAASTAHKSILRMVFAKMEKTE